MMDVPICVRYFSSELRSSVVGGQMSEVGLEAIGKPIAVYNLREADA